MKPQIEPTSTDAVLRCLGHAIDETKYIRRLAQAKDAAEKIKQEKTFSERLVHLNREISKLEKRLFQLRRIAK